MIRWLCFLICVLMLASAASAFADTPVRLRPRIESQGPMITLGDVFDGAGAEASRPLAPAPEAGQIARLNPNFLSAAAQAAGLTWRPPAELREVLVVHPAGMRATLAPEAAGPSTTSAIVTPVIRRGQSVLVSYEAPGLRITARARAMEDAAEGQPLRLQAMNSDRAIDAIATGPGAARAAQ